jgi:hypothetical protein
MTVAPTSNSLQAFYASRDAAVQRLQPTVSDKSGQISSGKSLTPTPRPVDPMGAVRTANGPAKGRHLDLVA